MIYNESKFNTEWDTLPLSKLGEFKRGKSKHRPRNDKKLFEGGIYPLVQTGEIKAANLLIKSHNAAYNEEGLKQSKMWPAGTLAITIAANIAETGILAYPMCFPDSCVGFIADKQKTSELFMHYVFTYIKRSIQNSAVGSIQDNINIEMLTALNFKIPKKPIQDLIVDLLATIDYKIELNNDINTELENLAKTIYNYWFVQFDFPNEEGKPYKTSGGEMEWNDELKREIPKGWEVKNLSDISEKLNSGGTPQTSIKEYYTGNVPWYSTQELQDCFLIGSIKTISEKAINESSAKLFPRNTVVIAIYAAPTVGRLGILSCEGTFNQACCGILADEKQVSREYLYLFLQRSRSYLNQIASGTAQKNLNVEKIKSLRILIPANYVNQAFREKMSPIFEQIEVNQKQNQELIKLRDFLLPMLMNGQVKVKSESNEQLSMAAEPKVKYGK